MAAAVILGGFVFSAPFEVPNKINFGGTQRVAVHALLGDGLVVDALGPLPDDIRWSGRFRGAGALGRAQALDQMRKSGAQYTLAWLGVAYNVVITEFGAETEKAYEVPFSITCKPVDNGGGGGGGIASLGSLVDDDLYTLGQVSTGAPSDVLTAISGLSSTVASAGQLQGLSSPALAQVETAANAVVSTIGDDMLTNDAALSAPSPDGSMPAVSAAWLTAVTSAVDSQATLAATKGYAARIALNLQLGSI